MRSEHSICGAMVFLPAFQKSRKSRPEEADVTNSSAEPSAKISPTVFTTRGSARSGSLAIAPSPGAGQTRSCPSAENCKVFLLRSIRSQNHPDKFPKSLQKMPTIHIDRGYQMLLQFIIRRLLACCYFCSDLPDDRVGRVRTAFRRSVPQMPGSEWSCILMVVPGWAKDLPSLADGCTGPSEKPCSLLLRDPGLGKAERAIASARNHRRLGVRPCPSRLTTTPLFFPICVPVGEALLHLFRC